MLKEVRILSYEHHEDKIESINIGAYSVNKCITEQFTILSIVVNSKEQAKYLLENEIMPLIEQKGIKTQVSGRFTIDFYNRSRIEIRYCIDSSRGSRATEILIPTETIVSDRVVDEIFKPSLWDRKNLLKNN